MGMFLKRNFLLSICVISGYAIDTNYDYCGRKNILENWSSSSSWTATYGSSNSFPSYKTDRTNIPNSYDSEGIALIIGGQAAAENFGYNLPNGANITVDLNFNSLDLYPYNPVTSFTGLYFNTTSNPPAVESQVNFTGGGEVIFHQSGTIACSLQPVASPTKGSYLEFEKCSVISGNEGNVALTLFSDSNSLIKFVSTKFNFNSPQFQSLVFSGNGSITFESSNNIFASSMVSGCQYVQLMGSNMADGVSSFTLNNGYLGVDLFSRLGPCNFMMNGGVLENNGISIVSIDSSASFLGGNVTGSGDLCFYSDGFINIDVNQQNIFVGCDSNGQSIGPSTLTFSQNLNSDVTIASSGTIQGSGFISGIITNQGVIYAGHLIIGASSLSPSAMSLGVNPITSLGLINATVGVDFNAGSLAIQSSTFADSTPFFNMYSGTLSIDSQSRLGPVPLNSQGGQIENGGVFVMGRVGSPANVSFNGAVSGGGQMFVIQDTDFNNLVYQSNLFIGKDNQGNLNAATVTINSQFSGALSNLSNSQLITGYGGIVNANQISNDGNMILGYLSSGTLTNATTFYGGPIQGNGNLLITSSGTFTGLISQNNISIGSLSSGSCQISINGGFDGTLINGTSVFIVGNGSMTGPNLQNFGNINPVNLAFSNGYQTGALDINNMPVTSSGGTIGLNASSIKFFNGSLTQESSSFLGYGADQFYMQLGQIISDETSYIGPSSVTLNGGQITNNGIMVIGDYVNGTYGTSSNSLMQGVSILGTGTTYAAENLNILNPTTFSQASLQVARALNSQFIEIDTAAANLLLNISATTSLINGTNGIMSGQGGLIIGTTSSYGLMNPSYMCIGTTTANPVALSFTNLYPFNNLGQGQVSPINGLNVYSGTVINYDDSDFGQKVPQINIYGGYIELQSTSDFAQSAGAVNITSGTINVTGIGNGIAVEAQSLSMSGGIINGNSETNIGPCPINISGGTIINGSIASIGLLQNGSPTYSKSSILGGNFVNNGLFYNASDLKISSSCILGTVINGEIFAGGAFSPFPGTLTLANSASITASIDNNVGGVIAGVGILNGTINNNGGGINPANLAFSNAPISNTLVLNFPEFTNDFGGYVGWGSQNITIYQGTVLNENSYFGGNNSSQNIIMNGGFLQNDGNFSTDLGGTLKIHGGKFSNTVYGKTGPVALLIDESGVLSNDGELIITQLSTSPSKFIGGDVSGNGTLTIEGLTYVYSEITQGLVHVQKGLSHSVGRAPSIQAPLVNNGTINANVFIGSSGLLYGTGVIAGDTEIQGELSCGPLYGVNGAMAFNGALTLDAGSQTDFWIGPGYNISHLIVNGDFNIQNGPPTLFVEKQTRAQYVGEYTFPDVITFTGGTTSISDFNIKSYYHVELLPGINPNSYDLAVSFSSLQPNEYPGNAGVVAQDLAGKNGYGSLDMQEYIDAILRLDFDRQEQVLLELCPQFKLIQYSLEKLMFTQEDYYARKLYEFSKGLKPFFDVGFNQYAQKGYSDPGYGFNSYHINSWTQNLGFTYGTDHGNLLLGLGAIESYFTFLNYPAKARYNTAIAEAGYLGRYKGFEGGIDFLASYTKIKSRRDITYFDLVAKNKHSAWNASTTLDLGYKISSKRFHFKPYDKVGYIFGQESHDKESGAGVLNLDMQTEKLSLLRNTLGFNTDYTLSHFTTFLDVAYVYETIFSSLRYKGSFVGTPGVMDFYATFQNHNFYKIAGGLSFNKDGFEMDITYQALASKKFLEQSAQIAFSKKF
jgi:hypothetical protein